MLSRWPKLFLPGFIWLTLGLGLASMLNLWREIGQPFGGLVVYHNITTHCWEVSAVTPPWWSGLRAGMAAGDTCLQIDGQPYGDSRRRYAGAAAHGVPTVTLAVHRAGQRLERSVPVVAFTLEDLWDVALPEFIGGLGFWLLALVVYQAQPAATLNRVFAFANCVIANEQWLAQPDLLFRADGLAHILDLANISAWCFLGIVFLHFALLYPAPLLGRRAYRGCLYGLYGVGGMAAVLYVASHVMLWTSGWSAAVGQLDALGYTWSTRLTVVGIFVFIFRLGWDLTSARRSATKTLSKPWLYILAGTVCATPPLLAWLWTSFAYPDPAATLPYLVVLAGFVFLVTRRAKIFPRLGPFGLTAIVMGCGWGLALLVGWGWKQAGLSAFLTSLDLRYLFLAFPTAFAFVILRYKSFRGVSSLFVVVLALASGALVADGFAALWWLSQPAAVQRLTRPPFPVLAGAVFLIGVFWSMQGSWRGLLARALHWEVTTYKAAHQFGQKLLGPGNQAVTPDALTRQLVEILELEQAAIWLRPALGGGFSLAGQAGRWQPSLPVGLPTAVDPRALPAPLRLRGDRASVPAWLEPVRQLEQAEAVCPLLAADGFLMGVLALGKRCDEEIFDERDLEVINTLAQQAALVLANAAQARTLRDLYQADIERVEAQRASLARELHDHLLNELAQLKLGVALQLEGRLSPESFLTRCDAFIADIRRLIGGLRPAMLDYGLGPALQAWAGDLAGRDPGLRVKVELADDQTRYDPRVEMHLYRIVQQAGENTLKHAQAQVLTIHGRLAAEGVSLEIVDDGQGFEARGQVSLAPLVADKHFGLAGMFERAAIIGADLRLDSTPGRGTCLHLTWSVKK